MYNRKIQDEIFELQILFQNIIAKLDLIKIRDILARSSVNAISFAIGSAWDFSKSYRKTMGIMGTSVRAYKVEEGIVAILVADVLYM